MAVSAREISGPRGYSLPLDNPSLEAERIAAERQRISAAFKALREKSGLTQEEVAHRVGLTLSGYRPYERGARRLNTEQFDLFAEAFGVPSDELRSYFGISPHGLRETQLSPEMQRRVEQLADLPPDVAEAALRWFDDAVELLRRQRRERSN